MPSLKCHHCLKVKRCTMHLTLDRETGATTGTYLCRPCARELGYVKEPKQFRMLVTVAGLLLTGCTTHAAPEPAWGPWSRPHVSRPKPAPDRTLRQMIHACEGTQVSYEYPTITCI